ncbi:MAG: tetratricopeptide repeat protein, partial [Acidobacteriota bacterium]
MLLIYRRVWIVSFVLLSLLVMFISMVTKADPSSPSVQERAYSSTESIVLEQGNPIERELTGGEIHSYQIKLIAGQFLNVVVEQKGIDIVAVLFSPDGKQLAEIDSPNRAQGPEPVLFITEVTGNHHLEIRSLEKTASAGHYKIKIEELRIAVPQDNSRITDHRAFAEGELLRVRGSAELLQKAIKKYEQALKFFRDIGDRGSEATALNNIGAVYDLLGEKEKALDYYNKALVIRIAIDDKREQAATLNNIGFVYNSLGNKQKGLDYYNKALPLIRAVGDHLGEASTLNNIGIIYYSIGEKERALDYYNKALAIIETVGDHDHEATALNNIGVIYKSIGEKEKALDYYNKALVIRIAINNRRGEASTLNNIGAVYDLLGEKEKALDYYNKALLLRQAVGDRGGEVITLNNIGIVYYSLRENQKALDYYNKALLLTKVIGDHFGEAKVLYNIARVERDQDNLVEAQATIENSIKLSESIRTNIINLELRSSYVASVQELYEFYIDLLMQLHRQNPSAGYNAKALEVSERARARSLLELLIESRADIRQGVDLHLVEKERSLQQRLTDKAEILIRLKNRKGKEIEISALEKEIEQLTTEFQQIQTEIRQKSPRYAALTQPQPLSLKEIQEQVLDQDTLLLEYALGKENSYLWSVTTNSISSYKLPKRDEIETVAKSVYQFVSSYENALTNADTTYWQAAIKLSQIIFGPVANQLGKKRLLIVSDGVLQHIPFAGLPLPTNTS